MVTWLSVIKKEHMSFPWIVVWLPAEFPSLLSVLQASLSDRWPVLVSCFPLQRSSVGWLKSWVTRSLLLEPCKVKGEIEKIEPTSGSKPWQWSHRGLTRQLGWRWEGKQPEKSVSGADSSEGHPLQSPDAKISRPGLSAWLQTCLSLWPWTSFLTSLSLIFF